MILHLMIILLCFVAIADAQIETSASGTATFPGIPSSLSDTAAATVVFPGIPSSLSDTAAATVVFPGLPIGPNTPAVARGGSFFGSTEQFNRYYTDSTWAPSRTLYVSPSGSNTNIATNTRESPAPTSVIIAAIQPGDMIVFLAGTYDDFNYQMDNSHSGTYNDPIVFYGERDINGDIAAVLNCPPSLQLSFPDGSCFNLENTHYIAIDGFEMYLGFFGVRSVQSFPGYSQAGQSKGLAVLNCISHGQNNDPFFTGGNSWIVFEENTAYDAQNGDGHGLYLSNGGDWGIIRFNEFYNNTNDGFQINADPFLTCNQEGIAYTDDACDGSANNDEGQGVTEFMLIEGNYFHDNNVGSNYTSMRNSIVRWNILGPATLHNVSFWQETTNPLLGSHSNTVEYNLFVNYNSSRHVTQFIEDSNQNTIRGNIFLALTSNGQNANASPVLIEMDASTSSSQTLFEGNYYIAGDLAGYSPNGSEFRRTDFDPTWFVEFPWPGIGEPCNWSPSGTAPYSQFNGWIPLWRPSC